MNDGNGDASAIGETCVDLLASLRKRRENLLGDLIAGFPAIRKHLLGYTLGDRTWPAGQFRIECDAAECVVSFQVPLLGVQASWRDINAGALLERIENDLDTGSAPWDHTWEVKKRNKEKARKAIGLA